MRLPFESITNKLNAQIVEPAWGWGFRVLISLAVPLLYGMITGNYTDASWMIIAAEGISIVELKGSITLRIRLLIVSFLFAIIFTLIGTIIGTYFILAVVVIAVIGVLCGMLRNLGDWGSSLTINIFMFYVLAEAAPTQNIDDIKHRIFLVSLGAGFAVIVGMSTFLFSPKGKSYRKTIASIWKAVAGLMHYSTARWEKGSKGYSLREIYLKEQEVRKELDASLALFSQHHGETKEAHQLYALNRKCASLASLHIIEIVDLTEIIFKSTISKNYKLQIQSILRALEQIAERMEYFVYTLRQEEYLIVGSRIERVNKLIFIAKSEAEYQELEPVRRLIFLAERTLKLVERAIELSESKNEKIAIKSYSFGQTLNILHPKYLGSNIRQMFNFDTSSSKYSLRLGVAAAIGLIISRLVFPTTNGYWIPFTIFIVSQPFFGATFKKGLDRSIGTIVGAIVGTLLLLIPFQEILRPAIILISAILMIYYLKKSYSRAAFFMTLFLIGLLNIEAHFSLNILGVRIATTIIGSAISILSGFIIFPIWDKNLLPEYMKAAILNNYLYFKNVFYYKVPEDQLWTKCKKNAETANSNAFDSISRLMQEPTFKEKTSTVSNSYYLLNHNIRITRELNNFNRDNEFLDLNKEVIKEKHDFAVLLMDCDQLFKANVELVSKIYNDPNILVELSYPNEGLKNAHPTADQRNYVQKMLIELKSINNGLIKKYTKSLESK